MSLDLPSSDESIPLPNVSSSVLVKVLEYCDHHKNEPLPAADSNDADDARRKASEIGEWDAKFIQVRVEHIPHSRCFVVENKAVMDRARNKLCIGALCFVRAL